MTTSEAISKASHQAAPNRTGNCNACQRTGLPILPLRAAYAPPPNAMQQRPVAGTADLKAVRMRIDQPRILREGYLYVLLDKKEWQAYQVTPEGALRQFRPFQMPREAPPSLSEACIKQDHDITASFINIDTGKYTTAWIAFASDPWPKSVLDRYRKGTAEDGTALDARFLKLDLKAARDNPASVGVAMTETRLQVDQQVLEYAAPTPGDFASVHSFSTRNHRLDALRGFVRTQVQRQKLPQGVLALVLPDAIGLVQEINHQRLAWLRERQAFEADPANNYKFYTSECLKKLRELCKQTAEEAIPDHPNAAWEMMPSESSGPPVFGDPAREHTEQVEHKTKTLLARLDDRYDEPARAAWERNYDARKEQLQRYVDQLAQLYATHIVSASFRLPERFDYDARVPDSVTGYTQTLEPCLRGGITEATPKPDAQGHVAPVSGPSATAWEKWIKDGQSIVYKTLLACDRSLLQGLAPTFGNQGELDWNDFEKLYTPVTKVMTSGDLGEKLIQPKVQDAIASVLAAYNGAVGRLEPKVSAGVRNVATRVNSAALLLYSHTYMTQVAIQMKLGDFYKLLCERIRDDRNKLVAAIEQTTGKAHKQVRSVLMGGVLSLALSDPKLAEQTVEVVVWVEGKASEVRETYGNLLQGATQHAGEALSELKVLAGTLEPGARKALAGLQLRAFQVTSLARAGLSGARSAAGIAGRTVGNAELLIAVGGTYLLSQSLRKSADTVDATFGAKHDEAVLAVYSASVGVLGGSIEALGLTMKAGAEQARKTLALRPSGVGAVSAVAEAGKTLARFGAVLGAVSGFIDATAAAKAAKRADAAGGESASTLYMFASMSYAFGAGFAVYAAYSGSTAVLSATWILGPVGLAVLFGMAAYALWKFAEEAESSLLERWAFYSHFGKAENKKWADAYTAVSALNAAVLGVDAYVRFESGWRMEQYTGVAPVMGGVEAGLTYVPQLEYQVIFPRYDASRAGYTWQLVVKRYSGDEVLASGSHQSASSASQEKYKPPKRLDYDPKTATPVVKERTITVADGSKTNFLIVEGKIELMLGHDISEATINLEYLPNVHDPEMVAKMEITEAK